MSQVGHFRPRLVKLTIDRVRFTPKADIKPPLAFMSTRHRHAPCRITLLPAKRGGFTRVIEGKAVRRVGRERTGVGVHFTQGCPPPPTPPTTRFARGGRGVERAALRLSAA